MAALLLFGGRATVADDWKDNPGRLFAVKVLPLLKEKCFSCHGDDPKDLRGKYNLTTRAGLIKGGESDEAAVVPGKPDKSPLYRAIRWEDLEMPPKQNDRLTDAQIALVRQWIAGGAPWPDAAQIKKYQAEAARGKGVRVATSGGQSDEWTNRLYQPQNLWAYQPLAKVNVPSPKGPTRGNPIDAFINRALDRAGITPAPPADRRTFIRRVTFDLTGLPPTPEQIEEFVNDRSPKAYENLVDRLLASPHYGEQMARHWLDVVRYADSAGFSNDFARPTAWRYRDYVIRSFNNDKPYDRFVTEQLAGDELDESDPENLIAVGYLRMGPWEHTGMSVAAVTRQQFLDDVVQSVGVTFLATEMRCLKCHDHKFDPLPTLDYYRMQAVFAPVQFADRDVPFQKFENTSGIDEGRERIDKLIEDDGITLHIAEEATEKQREEASLGIKKVKRKQGQIRKRALNRYKPLALSVYNGPPRKSYRSNNPLNPLPQNRNGELQEVLLLSGGSLESPKQKVTPGVLSVLANGSKERTTIPGTRDGRRLALARWITDPDNPLTSRVIVNRVWQWHFGKGIAANPNNFGKMGGKPTHPELLDWLARKFMQDGWSLKKLHRQILLSDVYRRSGTHPQADALAQTDPDNKLLSWFPPRRLAAEELRDAMLLVSGELNPARGGIPARPEINWDVAIQPRHVMGSVAPAYQASRTPAERNRRTIYALKIRTLRDPFLEVFDQPTPDVSCEMRMASTVTPQVFALFNSESASSRAVAMAARLAKDNESRERQVRAAFQHAFGREPTADELSKSLEHLESMTAYHRKHPAKRREYPKFIIREMVEEMTGLAFQWKERLDIYENYVADLQAADLDAGTRALADLCLVLLNSNEFAYVY
jgi:mono/diheme cytochrome c family protein